MLKDKNYDKMQNVRLPKQDTLPSIEQLREMYGGAIKHPGKTTELPFGDSFVLVVIRRPTSGGCTWTLMRWVGTTSTPEWEYDSNDPRWVHNQITEYFPRWSPHRRKVHDPADKDIDIWAPMVDADTVLPSSTRQATMEGELKYVGVPRLLRMIAKDRLTGQLEIDGQGDNAVVFFGEGQPMHSVTSKYDGEGAIISLITWRDGHFEFHTGELVNKKTIFKPLDDLLAIALSPDSVIENSSHHNSLSKPSGFYDPQSQGESPGPYSAQALQDATAPAAPAGVVPAAAIVDKKGVHAALTDKVTGCYLEASMDYFLDLEFERCARYSRALSLVTVYSGLKQKNTSGPPQPLPKEVLAEIGKLIGKRKRKSDLVGHYGESRLAIMMVETDRETAQMVTTRIAELLVANGTPELNEGNQIVFTIGLASAPTDATDLDSLKELATTLTRKFGW